MNATLYKQGMRSSLKMLVLFAAVLTMYFTVILTMYDPKLGSALEMIAKVMPQMMSMVGMTLDLKTLAGFMASYLYGFIMPVIPMVYIILTAHRLVAKQVDGGAMAYLLAAPVSRARILFTQLLVLLSGVALLVAYATILGIAVSAILYPGVLEVGRFLLLNLGALALQLFISGICFLASSAFNEAKHSVGFGAGIPALAYLIKMLANADPSLSAAKFFTFFSLFQPTGLLLGQSEALAGMAGLGGSALVLFGASMLLFTRKDIPV